MENDLDTALYPIGGSYRADERDYIQGCKEPFPARAHTTINWKGW